MKYFHYVLLVSILFVSCDSEDDAPFIQTLGPAEAYYLDIALGSEFGTISPVVRKWSSNMKVFLSDTTSQELQNEFEKIRSEINALSSLIQVERVATIEESNFEIYLTGRQRYVNDKPETAELAVDNWGLFWIYWQNGSQIYRGHMYVDIERTTELICQKHLLREELTQALGLMRDSYDYDNSMFYQNWTCGTEYASIDEKVIAYHLHPDMKPGMTRSQARQVLLNLMNM